MNRVEWERWLREAPEAARFRQRGIDGRSKERNAAALREMLARRWKDPEFRKRNAAALREMWKRRRAPNSEVG